MIWRYLFSCEGLTIKIWKMTPIRAGVNLGQANKGQRGIHLWINFNHWRKNAQLMRNTLNIKFVAVCNNREGNEYSFITYYYSITCIILLILFSQDSILSVAWKYSNFIQPRQYFVCCVKINKYSLHKKIKIRFIYPKLNTQIRFLKNLICRSILSSGDSLWAICGYISY